MSALFEKQFKFTKFDSEKGIAYGFAIVCTENGGDYWDLHGDHIPESAMEVAADEFMTSYRVGKDQHSGEQVGDIVFGLPLTKQLIENEGMTSTKTGFYIGYKPHDPVHFDMIASGERTGFSMGGFLLEGEETEIGKAVWSTAYVNALPDSAFLVVENGQRFFPVRDASGVVDEAHVRNALNRVATSKLSPNGKKYARKAGESLLAQVATTKSASMRPDGKKRGRVFRSFVIREISLVDRPAHEGALVTTTKSTIARISDEQMIAKGILLTSVNEGHQHVVWIDRVSDEDYCNTSYDYISNDDTGHSHKVLVQGNKLILSANAGHSHEVKTPRGWRPEVPTPPGDQTATGVTVVAASADSSTENDAKKSTEQDARARADLRDQVESGSVAPDSTMEIKMTEAEIAALRDRAERAEKRAERAEAIAAMSPAMQSYFGKLGAAEQTSFIANSASERVAAVDAAKVHTSADGTVYFTFDDPRLVALAKAADEANKRAADAAMAVESAEFAKAANADLNHLAGDHATHVAIVAAIAGIPDEKIRKAAFECIRSGNVAADMLSKASGYAMLGGAGGESSNASTPDGAYFAKRDAWATENKIDMSTDVAKAKATREFNRTPVGAAAYAAMLSGQV